jgi:hypothetical protein
MKAGFMPAFFVITGVTKEYISKPHTLTLALSRQGRGDLRIASPLRGGD